MRIPFGFFAGSARGGIVVGGAASTPFIHAWAWNHGFGAKFSNPGTIRNAVKYIDLSPDGKDVTAISTGTTAPVFWNYELGFDFTPITTDSVATQAKQNVRFNSDGTYILLAGKSSSAAYFGVFNNGTSITLSDEANLGAPLSGFYDAIMTPAKDAIWVITPTDSSYGIRSYDFANGVIGSDTGSQASGINGGFLDMTPSGDRLYHNKGGLYSFPVLGRYLGTSVNSGINSGPRYAWNTDRTVHFAATTTTPYITANAFNDSTGIGGTAYAAPSFLISGGSTLNDISFSKDQSDVIVSSNGNVGVYPWSNASGFGVKYAAAPTSPNLTSVRIN